MRIDPYMQARIVIGIACFALGFIVVTCTALYAYVTARDHKREARTITIRTLQARQAYQASDAYYAQRHFERAHALPIGHRLPSYYDVLMRSTHS